MRIILCIMILIAGYAEHARGHDEPTTQTHVQDDQDTDSIDALLNDVRQNPADQEPPPVRPVSNAEFWVKKIGTSILINYIKFKQYIAATWNGL